MEQQIMTFLVLLFPFYILSFLIYLMRVVKGPTVSDSVLAINALSFDIIAFMAILAIFFKSLTLIPVAMLLALWVYALDVFIAKYFEKREMGE